MMEETVRSFNKLPRPRTTPSGLPNHWVFGVCHVDFEPSGDLILAVHPQSEYLNQGGPAQILSLGTGPAKAEAMIPHLLSAFMPKSQLILNDPGPFAPWTWSTLDADMAQAVQDGLKKYGVTPELCQVGVCSAEERDTLESVRAGLFERLLQIQPHHLPKTVDLGDSTRCHGCGMGCETFFQPLKKCARCSRAFYHSRDCQKAHWKYHKPTCSTPANSHLDALTYYGTKAANDPDARALMRSLHIESHPTSRGLRLPLRRLVLTGQDTPKNMQLLFGPLYERSIKKDHQNVRIDCLLDPAPGSPSHVLNASMDDDSLVRSPRPATEAEQQKIKEVREMQALIRQRVGTGKSPSSADMVAILTAFGADWTEKTPTYTLATNTMDQGVPAGGYRR